MDGLALQDFNTHCSVDLAALSTESVKGKLVIDAFHLINVNTLKYLVKNENRQMKWRIFKEILYTDLIHGLNRHYYSISINYRKNKLSRKMFSKLHEKF